MLKRSLVVGLAASVQADLNFLDLKGIDDLVDHLGASPVFGYIALKTFLPNRRFFGNYGESTKGLCSRKGDVPDGLRKNKDCPLDANAAWVQRLFPSQDGANFVANQMFADVASSLSPEVIGALLERVSQVKDEEWFSDSAMDILETELSNLLFYYMNYEKFVDSNLDALTKKAVDRRKRKMNALNYLARDSSDWQEYRLDLVAPVESLLKSFGTRQMNRNLDALIDKLEGVPEDIIWDLWQYIHGEVASSHEAGESTWSDLDAIMQGFQRAIELNENLFNEVEKLRPSASDDIMRELGLLNVFTRMKQQLKRETYDLGKQLGDKADFKDLAQTFVEALKESRGASPVARGLSYPKYFPEHTLLAYFVRKYDSKADIVSLFQGMPSLVKDPHFLSSNERIAEFKAARWTLGELHPRLAPQNVADYWDSDFKYEVAHWPVEKLLFQFGALTVKSRVIPTVFSYGSVENDLGNGEIIGYADCGETSLRNFFNLLLHDPEPGIYNVEKFDLFERQDPETDIGANIRDLVQVDPALRAFYTKYKDPTTATKNEVRNEWALKVVSSHNKGPDRHAGIVYRKFSKAGDGFEIRSLGSPDNMLRLVGELLLKPDARSMWHSLSRNEKLDMLCKIVSRPGRELSWMSEIADDAEGGITVKFMVNDVPTFAWKFAPFHFEVRLLVQSEARWRPRIIDQAAPSLARDRVRLYVLPLLVADGMERLVVNKLPASVPAGFVEQMYYVPNMGDNMERLEMFKTIVFAPRSVALSLENLATRLRSKLPEQIDPYTARDIHESLLSAGYPYGVPVHMLGRPDAVYTMVPREELLKEFSPAVVDKIGKTWNRKLFGSDLWIASLFASHDNRYTVIDSFWGALAACNELNDASLRRRTMTQLVLREAALERMEYRNQFLAGERYIKLDCSHKGPVAKVFREMLVEGFHILSAEEFACIQAEMSNGDNFIMQFLDGFWYMSWTSLINKKYYYIARSSLFDPKDRVKDSMYGGIRCGIDRPSESKWSSQTSWLALKYEAGESSEFFRDTPNIESVMGKRVFKTHMFGREIIIGSPIYDGGIAIEDCFYLNEDEDAGLKGFSHRARSIEENRDVQNYVPQGGFYIMTAKEWQHVFDDIMRHKFEIDFITDFLDGAKQGCTYLTADVGMSYSCVNGLMPTPSDAILRCAYLVPKN